MDHTRYSISTIKLNKITKAYQIFVASYFYHMELFSAQSYASFFHLAPWSNAQPHGEATQAYTGRESTVIKIGTQVFAVRCEASGASPT